MVDRRWKRTERGVLTVLGGRRVPVSGRGDGPDGVSESMPWLSIEIKDRKSLPKMWGSALEQAERATKPGQLPIAVWHECGQEYRNSFVMLRLGDFVDWFGG